MRDDLPGGDLIEQGLATGQTAQRPLLPLLVSIGAPDQAIAGSRE